MANSLGVSSLGIEISPKRCRKAQFLNMDARMVAVTSSIRNISFMSNKCKKQPENNIVGREVQGINAGDNVCSDIVEDDESK